jgi:hypothetical protein
MPARAYTLEEVLVLGCEACHTAADGVCWLFYGCCAVRSDPLSGERLVITDPRLLPDGPWRPTQLGAQEPEGG